MNNYLTFLQKAGQGCISGRIVELPQLKPACAWAAAEIERLRAEVELLKSHYKDKEVCVTCNFWQPNGAGCGYCPERCRLTVADNWCILYVSKPCEHCGHIPCGCGG